MGRAIGTPQELKEHRQKAGLEEPRSLAASYKTVAKVQTLNS